MTAPAAKYEFKTRPMSQQLEALRHRSAWCREYFFWRMDLGTGKTKVCIDNAAGLFERGKINGLLVFCPNAVVTNWVRREIPAHCPDRVRPLALAWVPPSKRAKKWRARFDELLDHRGLACFVMNVEALATDAGWHAAVEFLDRRLCLLAGDEAATIKNHRARRTKSAIKLARHPNTIVRRLMDGWPVTQSPMDLYSQGEFLTPGAFGHASFYSFRGHFARVETLHLGRQRSVQKIAGYRNLDELERILDGFSYAVRKEECLDLPAKVYLRREVELTGAQVSAYEEMRDEMRVEFARGEVTAQLVISQIMRLQQILAGWIPLDDGSMVELPTRRLDALEEALEQTSGQSIVWCWFKPALRAIVARLDKRWPGEVREIHGDVDTKGRDAAIDDFQAGRARVIVGTPGVGGVGLTLTAARDVFYYLNEWSLRKRVQSEDRAHRIGQTKSVSITDFYAPGTVEETILDSLGEKRDVGDFLRGRRPEEILA